MTSEKLSDIVERETEPDDDPDADDLEAGEIYELGDPDEEEAAETAEPDAGFSPAAFEEEQARHAEALASLLGVGWQSMAPCPNCGGVGHMPAELANVPPILDDPDLVPCKACNAHGQRKTPSLRDGYELNPCTVCAGSGFRDRQAVEAADQAAAYAAGVSGAPTSAPPGYDSPPTLVWNPVTNQWDVIPAPSPAPVP